MNAHLRILKATCTAFSNSLVPFREDLWIPTWQATTGVSSSTETQVKIKVSILRNLLGGRAYLLEATRALCSPCCSGPELEHGVLQVCLLLLPVGQVGVHEALEELAVVGGQQVDELVDEDVLA